jgi:hypothetical protein
MSNIQKTITERYEIDIDLDKKMISKFIKLIDAAEAANEEA